ncbi:MAG: chromosome segregation SMC family protein [Candidatus Pacearchaeota archaeon]
MVYIKKIVMSGFKSFGKKVEIPFDKGINVIVGPNGSGKSNISDALCFALGRLSVKSMRAEKARNLIFMGSKYAKPASEACVELIFDNSDKSFSIERDEIILKRIVRRNGQSIYKINDEVKTRAEVIELLLQAGIDPYGFNLILQGQIQSVVKMHPEERRKIIEEVAGISIYEIRKEKSLKELEKTEGKLKEINATLRERTAYLKNLEKERAQALKYKELESTLKKVKASIISKKIDEKKKELDGILKGIDEKSGQKEKLRERAGHLQKEIEELTEKVNAINRHIQEASGLEQEAIHTQIANIKAELEGLKVRKENYENRKAEIERRIKEMSHSIPELEREIEELKKESPQIAKKASELRKKKEELVHLEEEKRKILSYKTELVSIKERIKDKERQIAKISAESEALLRQIEEKTKDIIYQGEEECAKAIASSLKEVEEKKKFIEDLTRQELENEKSAYAQESEITRNEKIKNDVKEIDICPLCQSKITENHKEHVNNEADKNIKESRNKIKKLKDELAKIKHQKSEALKEMKLADERCSSAKIELINHKSVREKKNQLKLLVEEERLLKNEIQILENKSREMENKTESLSDIESKYQSKLLEIEEISSRTEEDVDTSLLYKQRDVEQMKDVIKRSGKDVEELCITIKEIIENIEKKSSALKKKEEQENALNEKFKKMFESRDKMQKETQEKNLALSELQNEIRQIEEQINYLKIGKAQIDAGIEALNIELSEFSGAEIIKASIEVLQEKLGKTQQALLEIGSINMRALEVYDYVKKEYDVVQEKVNVLLKEKEDILKVIEEIDRKKTRTFMRTFKAINELFTQNFSKLYTKGTAFLEIENREDIFAGGIDIVIRLAKGKYFDVTSLSGGEQVLVALSLLFAIQEHKPYHFYVFDEIDAALDKRNSERLAALLNQYMKSGQYIVITHNDAVILNSDKIYGVSMHEGISKILSLQLSDELIKQIAQNNAIAPAQKANEQAGNAESVKQSEISEELNTDEDRIG